MGTYAAHHAHSTERRQTHSTHSCAADAQVNELLRFVDAFFYPWLSGQCCKLPGVAGRTFKAISHYKLMVRAHQKCAIVPGKLCISSTEPGSTRQPPCCGTVNTRIANKKFAFCNPAECGCGRDVSRDGSGACGNFWCGYCCLHADPLEYAPATAHCTQLRSTLTPRTFCPVYRLPEQPDRVLRRW